MPGADQWPEQVCTVPLTFSESFTDASSYQSPSARRIVVCMFDCSERFGCAPNRDPIADYHWRFAEDPRRLPHGGVIRVP